jgi:hypothetical protein
VVLKFEHFEKSEIHGKFLNMVVENDGDQLNGLREK